MLASGNSTATKQCLFELKNFTGNMPLLAHCYYSIKKCGGVVSLTFTVFDKKCGADKAQEGRCSTS